MPEKGRARQSTSPAPCEVLFACTICRASFKDVPQLFTHYSTSHSEETSTKGGRSQCETGQGDVTVEQLQSAQGKRKLGEEELSSSQTIDGSSSSGKEVSDGSAKKLQRFSGGDEKKCDTEIPASGSNESGISVTKDCKDSSNETESRSSKNTSSCDTVEDVSGKRKYLLSDEAATGEDGCHGDEGASSCVPGSKVEDDSRKRQKIVGRDGEGRNEQGLSDLVAEREEVVEATRKRSLSPMRERNVVRNDEYEQGRNCDKKLKTTETTPDDPVQCRDGPPEPSGGSTEEDACGGGTEQGLELDMAERADKVQDMDLDSCFPRQVRRRFSGETGDSASEDIAMQVSDAVPDVLVAGKAPKMDGICETSTEKEAAYLLSRQGHSECERDCRMEDLQGCGKASSERCGGDEESMTGTEETAVKEMGTHVVEEQIEIIKIDSCEIADEGSQCPGDGGQEESATIKKIESGVKMRAAETRQDTSDSCDGELRPATGSSEGQKDTNLCSAGRDSRDVKVSGCEDDGNETHRCSDKANGFPIMQAPCRTDERQTAEPEEVATCKDTANVLSDGAIGKQTSDIEKELTSGSQGRSNATVDKVKIEENTMTKSCAGVADTSSGGTGMGYVETKEGNSCSCSDGNETERRESVGQDASDPKQNTEGETEREVVSLAGKSDTHILLHSKEENAGIDSTNAATYVKRGVSTNVSKKQNTHDTCSESEVTLSGDKQVDGSLSGGECTFDNCADGIEAILEKKSGCGAVRRKSICLQGESLPAATERECKDSSCEGGSNGDSQGTFGSRESGLIESKEKETSETNPSDSQNDAAEKLSSGNVTLSRNRTEYSAKSSCEHDTLHSAEVESSARGVCTTGTCKSSTNCGNSDRDMALVCPVNRNTTIGTADDVDAIPTSICKSSEVNGKKEGPSSKNCSTDVQNTSVASDEVTTTSTTKASEVKGKEDGEQDTAETLNAAATVTGTAATADKSCATDPWREEDHCTVTVKRNVPLGMLKGRANSLMVLFQHANKSQPLPEGSTFKLSSTSGEMDYTVVANVDVEIREYGKQPLKP